MVQGLRILVLSFCITSVITLRADAQQNPPSGNSKIHQLIDEIKELRRQIEPIRAQEQQLWAQMKVLRERMVPLQEKMKAVSDQIRKLHGDNGK